MSFGSRPLLPLLVAAALFGACSKGGHNADLGGSDSGASSGQAWIDPHVHLFSEDRIDDYIAFQDAFGMEQMVLQCLERVAEVATGGIPTLNAQAFLARARYPKRFRIFGGLDLSILVSNPSRADDLAAQVVQLADLGVDGLKFLMRTDAVTGLAQPPYSFDYLPDSTELAPSLMAAEAKGLPILMHLDAKYSQMHGLPALNLYPNLTIILAHMGAASPGHLPLDLLSTALDGHSRLFIDIGGVKQLERYLVEERDATRAFFIRYADRIVAGTDIGAGCPDNVEDVGCPVAGVPENQAGRMRAVLETGAMQQLTRDPADPVVQGLELPADVLEKIYRTNIAGILGPERPVDCAKMTAYIDQLQPHTMRPDAVARLMQIRARLVAACASL